MNVHELHDLSNAQIVKILEDGLRMSGLKNYSPEFAHLNSNIFYILENEDRFKHGAYYVIEHNGEYVASSGWNKYDDETALVLARSYVSESFRTTYIMGTLLLPLMLEEVKHYPKIWITCNKNRSAIYQWFVRTAAGKRAAIFNNWPEIYARFEPIGSKTIYYTEQYVVQLKAE